MTNIVADAWFRWTRASSVSTASTKERRLANWVSSSVSASFLSWTKERCSVLSVTFCFEMSFACNSNSPESRRCSEKASSVHWLSRPQTSGVGVFVSHFLHIQASSLCGRFQCLYRVFGHMHGGQVAQSSSIQLCSLLHRICLRIHSWHIGVYRQDKNGVAVLTRFYERLYELIKITTGRNHNHLPYGLLFT